MGRDIQAIKISGEDRRRYRDKVRRSLEVFARMLHEHMFDTSPSQVGLEIELNLVDSRGEPSMHNADVLDAIADPAWATELGQFNLEINVPPRQLDGDAMADQEQEVRASLNAADTKARGTGSRLVMIGILPTLAEQDMTEGTLSANERYKVLNEQIFAARGENMRIEIDGTEQLITDADSITPEAACTSVQLHLQVSPDAFAHYWNAAQAIAGVQVALAANSPFLFGRQLWHETRITLFEQATDTRPDELKAAGGAAPGLVRRALDHVGVRSVRGEHPVLPGAAADLRGRGPAGGARPRRLPAAGRDEPAQRDRLPLEPAGLRRRQRQAAPPGREPGPPGRPVGRGRHGQRGVLLRARALARRGAAPGLDPDVLHDRGREPARGGAVRPGRAALLAGPRRGASGRARAAPPAAAGA